jgi:hypothetical protein
MGKLTMTEKETTSAKTKLTFDNGHSLDLIDLLLARFSPPGWRARARRFTPSAIADDPLDCLGSKLSDLSSKIT